MSENLPVRPPEKEVVPEKPENRKKKDVKTIIAIVLVAQVILAVFIGIFLFRRGYENSKTATTERVREEAYTAVYGATERANHVSNRVTISLDGIQEKADLEVLKTNAFYVYLSDEQDQERGQTIWYKIPGMGTFTVDMRMTEFIVDNERKHVLVKAPAPVMSQFREDYDHVEELYYKDDRFLSYGSVFEGEMTAQKMLQKAHVQMVSDLELNQSYYLSAEDAAAKLITNIIKALNPDIEDLTVTVVFEKRSAT